jgi:hypothetical protein
MKTRFSWDAAVTRVANAVVSASASSAETVANRRDPILMLLTSDLLFQTAAMAIPFRV